MKKQVKKTITSPKYSLIGTESKLIKSAAIVTLAVMATVLLEKLFPAFDFVEYRTAILTAVSAWVVNLVKEYTNES